MFYFLHVAGLEGSESDPGAVTSPVSASVSTFARSWIRTDAGAETSRAAASSTERTSMPCFDYMKLVNHTHIDTRFGSNQKSLSLRSELQR